MDRPEMIEMMVAGMIQEREEGRPGEFMFLNMFTLEELRVIHVALCRAIDDSHGPWRDRVNELRTINARVTRCMAAKAADMNDQPILRRELRRLEQRRTVIVVQAIVYISLAFAAGFFGAAWWA